MLIELDRVGGETSVAHSKIVDPGRDSWRVQEEDYVLVGISVDRES